MDSFTPTSLPPVVESPTAQDEDEPLELGSWFTLYESGGSPRSVIHSFEPNPKRAKGDVTLYQGNACVVSSTPSERANGNISINVYDVFSDVETGFNAKDVDEITMVVAQHIKYYVLNVPPKEVIPDTFVLQKQEGRSGDYPKRVFNLPGGRLADSLLPFFGAAEKQDLPITVLVFDVMDKFQLVAFGFGGWALLA